MNERMAKVRQETWEYMRENYSELWERFGEYFSLPEKEFGEVVCYKAKALYDTGISIDILDNILKEVYQIKLKENQ